MINKGQFRLASFGLFMLAGCFTLGDTAFQTCAHSSRALGYRELAQELKGTGVYDVKRFGARGDGRTLDTQAINKAITTAASMGGGTVRFPAGTYLSVSIHLQSNISLYIDQGATIVAAETSNGVAYEQFDLGRES